jgi:hypothetical protein
MQWDIFSTITWRLKVRDSILIKQIEGKRQHAKQTKGDSTVITQRIGDIRVISTETVKLGILIKI